MEWSYPWLSIDEDREYDDGDFARFYAGLFTNGVSLTTDDSLRVSTNPTGGMRVQVGSGAGFIDGRSYFNSTAIALSIPVASSTQERVDSIVLHMDKGLREIKLMVKNGSTIVNRTNDIYELQLATIRVPRNASNITADLITDKRADNDVCGYSTPFEKIDVQGLEEQYNALLQAVLDEMSQFVEDEKESFETDLEAYLNQMNTYITDKQLEFDDDIADILDRGDNQLNSQMITWQNFLSSVTDELTENQAVNLQNQINGLTANHEIFNIVHGLKAYPQVMVTCWVDGLGITGIGESTWLGSVPETLPVTIGYPSWNEVTVKVPINWKMENPVVTETAPFSYLLVEGRKSLRVRISEGVGN